LAFPVHTHPQTRGVLLKAFDLQEGVSHTRGSLTPSPSARSLSPGNSKEEEKLQHCKDAMVSVHFTAAAQNARLECLEAKAAEDELQMRELKIKTAEAKAKGVVESARWREKYTAAAHEVNALRKEVDSIESSLKSSNMIAAQLSAEHLQIECLRTEAVERKASWAMERERLHDEIYELRASIAKSEGWLAGQELQAQKAAVEASQVNVERCSEMEALAYAQADASRAIAAAESFDVAYALAEEERKCSISFVEAMKLELREISKNEEAAVNRAHCEFLSESEIARQACLSLHDLRDTAEQNKKATDRLRTLEEERRQHEQAALGLRAHMHQTLEHLFRIAGRGESPVQTLKEMEAQFLVRSEALSAAESRAINTAQAEARQAAAEEKGCELLRAELEAQNCIRRDLHTEFRALSSAAAAVSAVAVAKDQKIAELEANSSIMHAELAKQNESNLDHMRADKSTLQTSFDIMSNGSTLSAISENSGFACRSAPTTAPSEADQSTSSISSKVQEEIGKEKNVQRPLSEAVAILNEMGEREAAAAVEAIMAFVPQNDNSMVDTTSVPPASSQRGIHDASVVQLKTKTAAPSWEVAQLAMTEEMRKEIGLLREALCTSGSNQRSQSPVVKVKEAPLLESEPCSKQSQKSQLPAQSHGFVRPASPALCQPQSGKPSIAASGRPHSPMLKQFVLLSRDRCLSPIRQQSMTGATQGMIGHAPKSPSPHVRVIQENGNTAAVTLHDTRTSPKNNSCYNMPRGSAGTPNLPRAFGARVLGGATSRRTEKDKTR